MKRILSWLATLIIGVAIILFAVFNRQPMEVDLWPLPFTLITPLFAVVLVVAFVAFIAGGVVMWLSSSRVRQRARREHRRADNLEKDLATLKQQIHELESSQRHNRSES